MNRLPALFIILLGILGNALAEPSISGSLSETVTDVDHPVKLEIKVENARITRPPNLSVNGLSISFAGTATRTQILNFQASSVTIFTYIITPVREGFYEIPPVELPISRTLRSLSFQKSRLTSANKFRSNYGFISIIESSISPTRRVNIRLLKEKISLPRSIRNRPKRSLNSTGVSIGSSSIKRR
jgi:hypothetical protein